jgi:hypothetical protein
VGFSPFLAKKGVSVIKKKKEKRMANYEYDIRIIGGGADP